MVDFYQILGVPQSVGSTRIKEAFKRLALTYHPDKNPGNSFAEEKFKQVNEAYQTLSNPEKKAKYDLIFQYSSRSTVSNQPPYTYSSQASGYSKPFYRPFQAKPNPYGRYEFGWTYFKNQILAFSFVFIVAIFVFAFQAFYNRQVEIAKEQKAQIMKEKYEYAMILFDDGWYKPSLDSIINLIKEFPGEYQLRHQREEMIKAVEYVAENQLRNRDYQSAINNFRIVDEFQTYTNFNTQYYIAKSYQGMGNYQEAANVLEFMLITDYQNIELKVELATLYREVLGQPDKALQYLASAKDKIKQIMEITYGKAYEIVANPRNTPDSYYDVYFNSGLTNQKLDEHEEAIKDFNWAIFFRPNNPASYHFRGLSFIDRNRRDRACNDWVKSVQLGLGESEDLIRNHCH